MNGLRRQPPTHAPLSHRALARALAAGTRLGADPRGSLRAYLQRRYRADHVILLDSGTSALTLALTLAAHAVGRRDAPVALPAFGCYALATAALGAGLPVTLYDVDPLTLQPDLDSLHRVVRQGAQIVVVAPLFGFPVAWNQVAAIARAGGAMVVEDAAQGHGARWQRRPLGSWGALSVLSFARGKGWTGGGGGALLLRSTAWPASSLATPEPSPADELTAWARAAAQYLLARPAVYGLPVSLPHVGLGETRYAPPTPPRAMTRTAAQLLLTTRRAAVHEARARRLAGRRLAAVAADSRWGTGIAPIEGGRCGYLRFPVVTRRAAVRPELRTAQAAGVARSYPTALTSLPALARHLQPDTPPCPGARTLAHALVTLPTHSRMEAHDLDQLAMFLRTSDSASWVAARPALAVTTPARARW